MDDVTRNRIDSFENCQQWFTDNATGVDAHAKLKDTKDAFNDGLDGIHDAAAAYMASVDEGKEQTQVKAASREDGVEIAEKVHIAAKAAEPVSPGIEQRYPRPRNLNLEDLVNLLRSFAIGGNTDEDLLKDWGAPNGWPGTCTNTANAIEAAGMAQASAKDTASGLLAALLDKVDTQMQIKRTAGYLIDNVFANDLGALVSWKSASHVQAPPKKPKPPTP